MVKLLVRMFCKKQREPQSEYTRAALNTKRHRIPVINKIIIKSGQHFDHRHHHHRALSKSQDGVGESYPRQESY